MFYPADWSPVCGDQMTVYNEISPEWRLVSARLCQSTAPAFPLLADFEPNAAVAETYGAYRECVCERTVFVIDQNGTIVWSYLS